VGKGQASTLTWQAVWSLTRNARKDRGEMFVHIHRGGVPPGGQEKHSKTKMHTQTLWNPTETGAKKNLKNFFV